MSNVRKIVFGGLICAIHIAILMISMHLPYIFVDYVLMFVMPFFMAMYVIKCGVKHGLIVSAATLILGIILDVEQLRAILVLLPTLASGLIYGALVKYRASHYTMLYALALVNLACFFISAGLVCLIGFISTNAPIDYAHTLKEIFGLHDTIDTTIFAIIVLIIYCFAQAFLLHFIMKYQLKKMKITFSKSQYPPFWIFVLALISLVAAFFPYKKNNDLYVLINIVAVLFGSSIAIHGYQKSAKYLVYMLIAQAVLFLAVGVPLLATDSVKDTELVPYLIMFIPPFLYGAYDLFFYSYTGKAKLEV